jgi:hypothetical protein
MCPFFYIHVSCFSDNTETWIYTMKDIVHIEVCCDRVDWEAGFIDSSSTVVSLSTGSDF